METRIASSPPTAPSTEVARAAAEVLRAGGLVALPTETVYGLAADALNPVACARIFEAKSRPLADPLIVHIADLSWIEKLGQPDSLTQKLAETYWPGPLTLVMKKSSAVPDIVTGGQDTVAIRMSVHPVFRSVLKAADTPLAAPSANRFGRISPTCAAHVMDELSGRIPLIVDGGSCGFGIESTIVSIENGGIRVLRSGPITAEMLTEHAPVLSPDSLTPVTPGSMKSHYAPTTPLDLATIDELARIPISERGRIGLLLPCPASGFADGFGRVEILSESGNLCEVAANLYGGMRRLDAAGLDRVLAVAVDRREIGIAIMERLCKASARE